MKPEEHMGFGSIKYLENILMANQAENIFLVTGKSSYGGCGAKSAIDNYLSGFNLSRFCDFEVNPKIEDVGRGISLFREGDYDMVVAAGGGTVMDMAKLINIFSSQPGNPIEYIMNESWR